MITPSDTIYITYVCKNLCWGHLAIAFVVYWSKRAHTFLIINLSDCHVEDIYPFIYLRHIWLEHVVIYTSNGDFVFLHIYCMFKILSEGSPECPILTITTRSHQIFWVLKTDLMLFTGSLFMLPKLLQLNGCPLSAKAKCFAWCE